MKKGTGCKPINKGGGKWQIRICTGYDGAGKKQMYRETIQLDSKKSESAQLAEAIRYRDRTAMKLEDGRLTAAKGVTLKEYVEEWLESYCVRKGLKDSTIADYKSMLNHRVLPQLGKLKLREINASHLNKFLIGLQKEGLSGTTQRRHFNLLHLILGTATKEQRIAVNPADTIEPPKKDTKERPHFTPEQTSSLVEALNTHASTKWRAYTLLALASAMRKGEAVGLNWSDIDWQQRTISIRRTAAYAHGKGQYLSTPKTKNSIRTIKVDVESLEALAAWKREQNERRLLLGSMWHTDKESEDAVFTQDMGGRMSIHSPSQWFERFLQKHGLPAMNLHGLRHTAASLLLANGCPMLDVSRRLGHSRASTTLDIYGHAYAEADAGLADVMGSLMYRAK